MVKAHWTYPHHRPGRPPLPAETLQLGCRLARENPRWGYLRIVGEARKLGVQISKTSGAEVLRRNGLPPAPRRDGPSWAEFVRGQAETILARTGRSSDPVSRDPPLLSCSRTLQAGCDTADVIKVGGCLARPDLVGEYIYRQYFNPLPGPYHDRLLAGGPGHASPSRCSGPPPGRPVSRSTTPKPWRR